MMSDDIEEFSEEISKSCEERDHGNQVKRCKPSKSRDAQQIGVIY